MRLQSCREPISAVRLDSGRPLGYSGRIIPEGGLQDGRHGLSEVRRNNHQLCARQESQNSGLGSRVVPIYAAAAYDPADRSDGWNS